MMFFVMGRVLTLHKMVNFLRHRLVVNLFYFHCRKRCSCSYCLNRTIFVKFFRRLVYCTQNLLAYVSSVLLPLFVFLFMLSSLSLGYHLHRLCVYSTALKVYCVFHYLCSSSNFDKALQALCHRHSVCICDFRFRTLPYRCSVLLCNPQDP